ncbi:MAG: DUF2461 domain-containing protein [Planctomycetes bacterium]|nr:DUF2461 domain-containing protein [Planctomycetota bacterium]
MAKSSSPGFEKGLFRFLEDLAANNNRDWFQDNKNRYESDVVEPCLAFIADFESRLRKISSFFRAVAKKTGGSLMRIYRDTRFSKDKTPYKTNIGIHFRHELSSDVHAPAFYIHIEPNECFLAAGVWHPDGDSLRKIRSSIDEESSKWKRARDDKRFQKTFKLEGESLKKPPRGFDPDHAYIEDLKRKDFIGVQHITRKQVLAKSFIDDVANSFAAVKPLVSFLCGSLQIPI